MSIIIIINKIIKAIWTETETDSVEKSIPKKVIVIPIYSDIRYIAEDDSYFEESERVWD
jgi:hypothetical protein